MKKFTYLLAVAAVFTACNSGNNGYTVTGTVEGAADGDTVYLETVEGRQFVKTARLKSTCRRKTTLPPVLPTMMPTRKSEPKSTV